MLNYFDYIVVGAGFAGSVVAERIASVEDKRVLIIEKREHIGGNCYDEIDKNGINVHKYGPHLFHTNNESVMHYLSKFTSWNIYNHKVLVFIDGKKVPLPFNFNSLYQLFPLKKASEIEEQLLKTFEYGRKVSILKLIESEEENLKFLAEFIYKKVFLNYTLKQWGVDPKEIDKNVLNRVPISISRDDRYFDDKYQLIPSEGYTKIFTHMLKHKNIKLLLNTNFNEIMKLRNGKIYVFGKEYKGTVIFTGPIDELFEYKFGELSYRSLDLVFETVDKEYFQNVATVNYPNDYDFTRITEFKHIHPSPSKKTTILKEYPKSYNAKQDIPYYPMFTEDNRKKYEKYAEYAKKYTNLILLGRLAEYKYFDMDDVIERALLIFENKVKGK